jgi:hypothetical protein
MKGKILSGTGKKGPSQLDSRKEWKIQNI